MEKVFLNIHEFCEYSGLKKSNLYAKVERQEIPFYRVGRLIMFKKDEVDAFMEKCRVECFDIGKESKRILRATSRSEMNTNEIVKKAIEGSKKKEYTSSYGKPGHIKGLRKEVEHGSL